MKRGLRTNMSLHPHTTLARAGKFWSRWSAWFVASSVVWSLTFDALAAETPAVPVTTKDVRHGALLAPAETLEIGVFFVHTLYAQRPGRAFSPPTRLLLVAGSRRQSAVVGL